MEKLALLRTVRFGESVAEQEMESLQDYFVCTHQWQKVFDGDVDVVYGPKGSGKSAIYSLISTCARQFSEREFVNLWKLSILALVSEVFLEGGAVTQEGKTVLSAMQDSGLVERGASLKAQVSRVRDYVRRYFNPASMQPTVEFGEHTGRVKGVGLLVTFMEPTPEMLKLGVQSVDALLDRLDVAFSDSTALEEDALRALFRAYLDLAACEHIKLKIFLRSDIW